MNSAFDIKLKEQKNKTLIVLSGISGSGKTTWAKTHVMDNPGTGFIERDIIRRDYFMADEKTVLSKKQENKVTVIQKATVHRLFAQGFHTVIVSDTNLKWKHVNEWQTMAYTNDWGFQHNKLYVDLNTALERNAVRPLYEQLPESVIKRQYRQYIRTFGKTEKRPLIVSSANMPAIMYDLDGTVQLMFERSPYDGMASIKDFPNASVIIVLQGLMKAYPDAVFIAMSGRQEEAYDVTFDALRDYGIEPDFLLMREDGDNRSDDIIKDELYNTYVKPYFDVIAVFDDRNAVCNMWRDKGLHCFQVAPGDF